ncbi:MAG: SWIM zinc finger domain-containing protein [Salinibacter sp.]
MTIPYLTRAKIEENTSSGSFERGQQYLADGSVRSIQRPDEQTLKAQVQGRNVHPYLVTITFDADDIQSVQCTCPYHGGSWCKHIVAVLLKTLKLEEIPVAESARLNNLVDDLSREEIVALLKRLVQRDPQILDQIRTEHPEIVDKEDAPRR